MRLFKIIFAFFVRLFSGGKRFPALSSPSPISKPKQLGTSGRTIQCPRCDSLFSVMRPTQQHLKIDGLHYRYLCPDCAIEAIKTL